MLLIIYGITKQLQKRNVMFNALEGTTDVLMKPIEIWKSLMVKLPTATKDGYLFDGWYTEKTVEIKLQQIPL